MLCTGLHICFFCKEALCSFGEEFQTQNCNICNINEVIKHIKTIFILFCSIAEPTHYSQEEIVSVSSNTV